RRRPRARDVARAVRARRSAVALLPRTARGGRAPDRNAQRARRAQARPSVAGAARRRRPDVTERGEYLAQRRQDVDRALEAWLPAPPACPAPLSAAMRYSLMAGGKRLRPVLVLASAEAVAHRNGISGETARALAMPAACALEMIHTYSLIHDDL